MIRVSIVGASGYAGGELLRILSSHPEVEICQAVSRSRAGRPVHSVNPNLRKAVSLKYSAPDELKPCDALFLCLPHGEAMNSIDRYIGLASRIIDLSADFRLSTSSEYEKWYGALHTRTDLLERFVYGIPELNRDAIASSSYVACAGCNATAVILGIRPIVQHFDVRTVVAEVKVGSSEGGSVVSEGSHHPLRSGAVRSYRPTGHRHVGEMLQELDVGQVHFSATAIEMVRGIVATCHLLMDGECPSERDIWKTYRNAYGTEPFIRIVKDRSGAHRYPDCSHLAGTNYCDIGFERDDHGSRIVVISAMDNLVKGAAGQAVQAFNIMHGLPEGSGLEFPGLFPI